MSEIAGAFVDWGRNPDSNDLRILWVPAPITEVTIQDILDTCRAISDDVANIDKRKLILRSGGEEELSSGDFVGLTVTANNMAVAFEARHNIKQVGTVTTGHPAGTDLYDASALFLANGVTQGMLIRNLTDGSTCEVLTTISDTLLYCTALSGGVDNEWGLGDSYKINEIVRCSISGGNLVARSYAGANIPKALPTFGVYLETTESTAASTANQTQLEAGTFGGRISIDVENVTGNAVSGTSYPAGAPHAPSSNVADALLIDAQVGRGFRSLRFISSATLAAGVSIPGFQVTGANKLTVTLTVEAGADVTGCNFRDLTLSGSLDDNSYINECVVLDLGFVEGDIHRSEIEGEMVLGGAAGLELWKCYSGRRGALDPAIINVNGGGRNCSIVDFHGHLKVRGMTDFGIVAIHTTGAHIQLEDTNTAGFIHLMGNFDLTDESADTCVVVKNYQLARQSTLESLTNAIKVNQSFVLDFANDIFKGHIWCQQGSTLVVPSAVTVTLYDEAGNTVFSQAGSVDTQGVFQLTKTTAGIPLTTAPYYTIATATVPGFGVQYSTIGLAAIA